MRSPKEEGEEEDEEEDLPPMFRDLPEDAYYPPPFKLTVDFEVLSDILAGADKDVEQPDPLGSPGPGAPPLSPHPIGATAALRSPQGIAAVKKYYENACNAGTCADLSGIKNLSPKDRGMQENEFYLTLDALTDLPEHEINEIFDILDVKAWGTVSLPRFHMALSLMATTTVKEKREALYLHRRIMHENLLHYPAAQCWMTLRVYGLMLDVDPWNLRDAAKIIRLPLACNKEHPTTEQMQLLFFIAIDREEYVRFQEAEEEKKRKGGGGGASASSGKGKQQDSKDGAWTNVDGRPIPDWIREVFYPTFGEGKGEGSGTKQGGGDGGGKTGKSFQNTCSKCVVS